MCVCARPGKIKVCHFTLLLISPHSARVRKCLLIFGWPKTSVNHHFICRPESHVYVCHKIVHFDLHAKLLSELFNIYGKIQMEYVMTFSYLWCQRFGRDFQQMPDTETDERTHCIYIYTQSTFLDSSLLIKIKCCENAKRSDYKLTAAAGGGVRICFFFHLLP